MAYKKGPWWDRPLQGWWGTALYQCDIVYLYKTQEQRVDSPRWQEWLLKSIKILILFSSPRTEPKTECRRRRYSLMTSLCGCPTVTKSYPPSEVYMGPLSNFPPNFPCPRSEDGRKRAGSYHTLLDTFSWSPMRLSLPPLIHSNILSRKESCEAIVLKAPTWTAGDNQMKCALLSCRLLSIGNVRLSILTARAALVRTCNRNQRYAQSRVFTISREDSHCSCFICASFLI